MSKQVKLFQDFDFAISKSVVQGHPTALGAGETVVDTLDLQVADKDASVIYIEGYASVFLNPDGTQLEDRDGESVNTTMLSIDDYKKNPILVYNHDWSDVVGRVTDIQKDYKGLYIKAEVHKLTGRESVFETVQKGLLKSFSIGFVPKTFKYIEESDILEIASADLCEISLAPVQSNQDALFTATGQKSLQVSPEMVKSQNNMTCDELTGICTLSKKLKGTQMKEVEKEPVVEPVAEPVVEPVAEPVAEPKDIKVEMDVGKLAAAVAEANELAAEKKAEKEATEQAEKEATEKAEKEAAEARVTDAIAYVTEQRDIILATPAADIDTDKLSALYELTSGTAEVIEAKVLEAIEASKA